MASNLWSADGRVFSTADGLSRLKKKGFDYTSIVRMKSTDYLYKDGIVGLYTVNETLLSVILDFPASKHEEIQKIFGLQSTELINIPYNKYLENNDRLIPQLISSLL